MKKILYSLGILFACSMSSHAVQFDVREMSKSTATVVTIDIATHTATAVSHVATFSSGTWATEIYNQDADDTINCGFSVAVSTISTESNYGREILPKVGVLYQAQSNDITLHCQSQNTTGATRATITQQR